VKGAPEEVAELKRAVLGAIAAGREEIIGLADDVWQTPELGFKEVRTSSRVASFLHELGLPVRTGLALTGVSAVADGRAETAEGVDRRPRVAVIGELDAVICPGHPAADPVTGAAHACGHHAQLAVMAGAALGLVRSGALDHLAGSVVFMAAPAEEYVEIEYRLGLRREGKIEFLGGKPELIRLGEFDDIDMAILVHAGGLSGSRVTVGGTSNGFIAKYVRYEGRVAHAGASPWAGANALNSATLALAAINALRETFNDDDHIRVHPIVTKGGDLVNVIPSDVRLETYVRGRSLQVVGEVSAKIDRAFKAGALAMDTMVEIQDLPGFLPMINDSKLARLFRGNMESLTGSERVVVGGHMSGSTDMGDLAHLMPVIHPYGAGATGRPHGPDFAIVDPDQAYVQPAQGVALTVVDVLADGAREAGAIRRDHEPAMTRSQYVEQARSLFRRTVYADGREAGPAREDEH
jgi:amidohydrolase